MEPDRGPSPGKLPSVIPLLRWFARIAITARKRACRCSVQPKFYLHGILQERPYGGLSSFSSSFPAAAEPKSHRTGGLHMESLHRLRIAEAVSPLHSLQF